MKKTQKSLRQLMQSLEETRGAPLKGGFGTLKGGTSVLDVDVPAINDRCNNTYSCANTNMPECTNSFNCVSSSNKNGCTNSGHCFA